MGMEKKGLVYVATGEKYIREAEISAQSAQRVMPDIPIALFTNDGSYQNPLFSYIFVVESYSNMLSDKIDPLLSTPFEKSIFIDTDTYLCDGIEDVFELLDNFDLAVAHAYDRRPANVPVPDCFPELNTGVIAFVRSPKMDELLKKWRVLFDEYFQSDARVVNDQAAFRKVLYDSDLRFYILPPEYNMRPQFPAIAGRGEKMKVLHAREIDHEEWRTKVNSEPSPKIRVTIPSWDDYLEGRLLVMHKSKVEVVISGFLKLSKFLSGLFQSGRKSWLNCRT